VNAPAAVTATQYDVLKDLWDRLTLVSQLASELDQDRLDAEDRAELDAVKRITGGYATWVMEMTELEKAGQVIETQALGELQFLVVAHCEDSSAALRMAIKEQKVGAPPRSVRIR